MNRLALAAVSMLLCLGALPSLAAEDAALTPQEQRFLALNQQRITASYAVVNGQFYYGPRWDRAYDNSAHQRLDRWLDENTERQRVSDGVIVRTVENKPPREEALVATRVLPELAPGHYGYIHSAKVAEVLGPDEMIVTDIWPIDVEQYKRERQADERKIDAAQRAYEEQQRLERERERYERERERRSGSTSSSSRSRRDDDHDRYSQKFDAEQYRRLLELRYREREKIAEAAEKEWKSARLRVVGYPTTGVVAGQRWKGAGGEPQIVIVGEDPGVEKTRTGRSRSKQMLALSGAAFARPLTDAQFNELLASAKMTPSDFVNLSRDLMREHGFEAAQPRIIAALEKARQENAPPADEKAAGESSDKPQADDKSDDKSDWFKKKYGNRLKDKKSE